MVARSKKEPVFQGPKLWTGTHQVTTTINARQLDINWESQPGKVQHRISLVAEEAHGRILITIKEGEETLTKSVVASKVQAALKPLVQEG